MNDLLIEKLLQKESKEIRNNKKKKANIFLNLQSNFRNSSNSLSHFLGSKKTSNLKNNFIHKKGGIVVNKQSIVLKTNFGMSGRMNKKGLRPTSKQIGSHASASLSYMDNHGSKDLERNEELSNIYDKNGDLIPKEELEQIKKNLNLGIHAFRRNMIDIGQKDFSRDDLNKLVRESMQSLMERTGKNFEYNYTIHTNTDHIHAHILSYGKNSDINLTKEQLQIFKEIIGSKTEEILLDMQNELTRDNILELKNESEIVKNLDNKNDLYL